MKFYRDGLEEEVDALPKVSINREGHVIEAYKVNGKKRFFVTLKGSFYCSHGSTVAEAVADAIWKDPARRPSLEALKSEIVAAGPSRKISLQEFRVLTGACKEGCAVAIKRAGVDGSPMLATEICDVIDRQWGEKLIAILGFNLERK
jgi:hypothetical protein